MNTLAVGDRVAYLDEMKRKAFGDMEVVRMLGDRVRVRIAVRPGERRIRSRSAKHWLEDVDALYVVDR